MKQGLRNSIGAVCLATILSSCVGTLFGLRSDGTPQYAVSRNDKFYYEQNEPLLVPKTIDTLKVYNGEVVTFVAGYDRNKNGLIDMVALFKTETYMKRKPFTSKKKVDDWAASHVFISPADDGSFPHALHHSAKSKYLSEFIYLENFDAELVFLNHD